MRTSPHCRANAGPDRLHGRRALLTSGVMALLASCSQPSRTPQVAATAPPPAPLVQPVPFPQAVLNAANGVFSATPTGGQRQLVVIDPLVNGVTGEQTTATQQIQNQIVALAREKYPQFDVQPFAAAAVAQGPFVMVGTFTPVNAQGQTAGTREGYRFCLVMVDLKAGKTVAKSVTRAQMGGVDATPIGFFRDSPSWTSDASVKSYIDTCQATKVGDPISQTYLNGIMTAAIISDAIEAYDAGRYRDALDLYTSAQKSPAGNQLRVYNGVYLTNWMLRRRGEAEDAFGRLVNYGLDNKALGMKILFRPGSTSFDSTQQTTGPYDMWVRQIAAHSADRGICLQVTGNTSPSGSVALNDQLSQLRADYVKQRLEEDAPGLKSHLIATGVGSKNNLVGTGADNLSDALDRRVDFKVIPTC